MPNFRDELEELQRRLLEMGWLVESSIHNSMYALAEGDEEKTKAVMWSEALINQTGKEIYERATRLLALFQLMARDLRSVTLIIKLHSDLERMGTLAMDLTNRSLTLMKEPALRSLVELPRIGEFAQRTVRRSLDAFRWSDETMASDVLKAHDEMYELRDAVYDELLAFMQETRTTVNRTIALMHVSVDLVRMAEQATNFAVDVAFFMKGVTMRRNLGSYE